MNQQPMNINQEMQYLLSNYKWRNCQRKQYNVYCIVAPAGFVFANRLEQPQQYKYLKQKFKKAIVEVDRLTAEDKQFLGKNCYITDGKTPVLCGLKGELWTTSPKRVVESYTKVDGSPLTNAPTKWTEISRKPESAPSAKGMLLPLNFLGTYTGSYGVLNANDPNSDGHYKGDIIVMDANGNISITNNEVFALTYNQTIGGWAQSNDIAPVDKIKTITYDEVCRHYSFGGQGSSEANGDRSNATLWIEAVKKPSENSTTILAYVVTDGKQRVDKQKEQILPLCKAGKLKNARVETFNGADNIRPVDKSQPFKVIVVNNTVTEFGKAVLAALNRAFKELSVVA